MVSKTKDKLWLTINYNRVSFSSFMVYAGSSFSVQRHGCILTAVKYGKRQSAILYPNTYTGLPRIKKEITVVYGLDVIASLCVLLNLFK